MVTYGGMAKQSVMVPVVSTGDAPPLCPVLHRVSPCPRRCGHPALPSCRLGPSSLSYLPDGVRYRTGCVPPLGSWLFIWRVWAAGEFQWGNGPAGAEHQTCPDSTPRSRLFPFPPMSRWEGTHACHWMCEGTWESLGTQGDASVTCTRGHTGVTGCRVGHKAVTGCTFPLHRAPSSSGTCGSAGSG